MNRLISLSIIALVSMTTFASADYIDDMVTKAEKSVVTATARLEKARACQADRVTCLEGLRTAAQKSADRAAKKLEAINASTAK
jgi:hypothetical protein